MNRLVEIKARYYGHVTMVYYAKNKFTVVLTDVETGVPMRFTFPFSQIATHQFAMLRPMLKINMLEGVDSNGEDNIELFFYGEPTYPHMEEE